jgi:glycosyltransferase involved in cell wall biosynthesis
MTNTICLDEKYSTTRLLTQEKPEIINSAEDKFETVLFLPEGEGRRGEGGLRTKGYFKKSYENKPLISIITVVFNGEKYLEETIQSVINQTYDNVEYIIIDGGSSDGTLDIIKKYEDRIDYWVSERDRGIYDAMNKGVDVISGEWINFMNAGDEFYSKHTLNEFNIIKKNGNVNIIYGDVEILYNRFTKIQKAHKLDNIFLGMRFSHQSTFYKKSYIKNNKYNLDYKLSADYESILKAYILDFKGFLYINKVISKVLFEGTTSHNKIKSTKERIRIIKNLNKWNIVLSCKYNYIFFKDFIKYELIKKTKLRFLS